MSPVSDVWLKRREALRNQRAPLSRKFDKNPNDLRLALTIKAIDDQIATCTEHITAQNALLYSHKLG